VRPIVGFACLGIVGFNRCLGLGIAVVYVLPELGICLWLFRVRIDLLWCDFVWRQDLFTCFLSARFLVA
jgi:hypothetical protein